MVWGIWTAITDGSLACNVLNVRTDVRRGHDLPWVRVRVRVRVRGLGLGLGLGLGWLDT